MIAETLKPGWDVRMKPEWCEPGESPDGWRVIEDRGDRVLLEAAGLLAGSAVENPQQTVAKEYLEPVELCDYVNCSELAVYALVNGPKRLVCCEKCAPQWAVTGQMSAFAKRNGGREFYTVKRL